MRDLIPFLPLLVACNGQPAGPTENPNDGLFRDFLDGKFDGDGHPLNARITDGTALCQGTFPCTGALAGSEQFGTLVANARLHVTAHDDGDVVTLSLASGGEMLATDTLTADRLRDETLDLPLTWSSSGAPVDITIAPAAGASIELAYVEVFPERFGLVAAPGSGVYADADVVSFELTRGRKLDRITADGVDITSRIDAAAKTTTTFRTVYDIAIADLLPDRGDVAELMLHAGDDAARVQIRKDVAACDYTGAGTKVLITGFQPFPADGWHDNVSGVAVTAVDPSHVPGVAIMKLVLPVEYDRAAAIVTGAIARCRPDLVISFGQGGGEIALEHVAYNLQDTAEVTGGVPDNRGIIRANVAIDPAAEATRDTLLPIDAIRSALEAAGESPADSTDPGRYICNNVFFADVGAMAGHGRAGFIHLPYTTEFDAATRSRFAGVVETAIRATVEN